MLILTRRSDESIVINNNISVKVLRIQGNQVQLGIVAPKDVSIFRQEIHEQIISANKSAVSSNTNSAIEQLKLLQNRNNK